MSWRALSGWRARPVFGGLDGRSRGLLLLLAVLALPPPFLAPFLGEESYIGSLVDVVYFIGILFFAHHLIRWPRWLRDLHRRIVAAEKVEPEKVKALGVGMLAELAYACFWVLGAENLHSAEIAGTYAGPVPLPLVFFALLVLAALPAAGVANARASKLGLYSTTYAIKNSKLGRLIPEAADELDSLPLYKAIGERFRDTLPGRTAGTSLVLLALLSGVTAQAAVGYVAIGATNAVELHILHRDMETRRPNAGHRPDGSGAPPGTSGDCLDVLAGEPAPAPRGEELRSLWFGGTGVKGVGSELGGCPAPAAPEPGQPEVWLQRGYCDEELEGLGVASAYGEPAMLLQEAAREAWRLGQEGVLLSASPRERVREGDLHLLQSTRGSYVLVRSKRSGGEVEHERGEGGCGHFEDRNVPYTMVPPGLVGIWRQILDHGWAWPEGGLRSETGVGSFTFQSARTDEPVGGAYCVSEISCEGSFEGHYLPQLGIFELSLDELLVLAER